MSLCAGGEREGRRLITAGSGEGAPGDHRRVGQRRSSQGHYRPAVPVRPSVTAAHRSCPVRLPHRRPTANSLRPGLRREALVEQSIEKQLRQCIYVCRYKCIHVFVRVCMHNCIQIFRTFFDLAYFKLNVFKLFKVFFDRQFSLLISNQLLNKIAPHLHLRQSRTHKMLRSFRHRQIQWRY